MLSCHKQAPSQDFEYLLLCKLHFLEPGSDWQEVAGLIVSCINQAAEAVLLHGSFTEGMRLAKS